MRREEEREFHSDRRARVEGREEEGRAGSRGGEEGKRFEGGQCGLKERVDGRVREGDEC